MRPNKAAAEERRCWINKIKRELRSRPKDSEAREVLERLLAWGKMRVERLEKPGGLGKK